MKSLGIAGVMVLAGGVMGLGFGQAGGGFHGPVEPGPTTSGTRIRAAALSGYGTKLEQAVSPWRMERSPGRSPLHKKPRAPEVLGVEEGTGIPDRFRPPRNGSHRKDRSASPYRPAIGRRTKPPESSRAFVTMGPPGRGLLNGKSTWP